MPEILDSLLRWLILLFIIERPILRIKSPILFVISLIPPDAATNDLILRTVFKVLTISILDNLYSVLSIVRVVLVLVFSVLIRISIHVLTPFI